MQGMSYGRKSRSAGSVLCTKPKAVQFTLFTTEDIKKLAVCKIISPVTFDALGYPLPGGLYDKHLGPISEKSDPCQTCFKGVFSCPGHFGYINLPVPVVNPLFHKVVSMLLRHSCLQCFHIQVSGALKYTLNVQMQLLARGKLVEAHEMAQIMSDIMGRHELRNELPEELKATIKAFEMLIEDEGEQPQDEFETNKNIEDLRNKMQYEIWKGMKTGKRCYNCKAPPVKLVSIRNKLIITERQSVDKNDPNSLVKAAVSKPLHPDQSRKFIRLMWEADKETLMNLFPVLRCIQGTHPTDVFFMEVVAVPPCNVRPVNVVAGRMSEHSQTAAYKRVLQTSQLVHAVVQVMQSGSEECLPVEARAAYTATLGNSAIEKLSHAWDQLQTDVNGLVDNEGRLSGEQGLKQLIEKKSGIIRQHMMGKRVNFAARSVITPDPNLNVDEIGIPEVFAKHLTYPVPVTSWNVEEMRRLITNGPNVHPGAVLVEFEDGKITRIPEDAQKQEALLKRLLTPDGPNQGFRGLKTVHRHLCNGDVLLLNRQPTLHRPSIMAHTARVLKDEKTLRLHYANCKAYNADFDGDEMNAHFPQNEIARSEGYNLVNVANQYLGPKDGTPLSGLIQDHMIAGVKMSMRGRFFNRMDYQQLVFQALSNKLADIELLPPAILKPQHLWSGKQVLSTVIINMIPKGRAAINLTATSKIPAKAWQNSATRPWRSGTAFINPTTMSEAEVIIRGGQLLVGILDKTHYGATPYGLVHCMYELYGGTCAIKLLSAFAKLFTSFLQTEGFTLGVEDILVLNKADAQRSDIIRRSREIGAATMCKALNLAEDTSPRDIVAELERQSATNKKLRAIVDRQYKSALDSFTNDVNRVCLPSGLIAKFPDNNLQLMVQSGAKGSTVNTMQISCMLGQIELEGKRPPVMISGRSLPSFPAHDFSPRAGGYIDGRFMTGIQPQEFFFHCMAGREGLIDTAVKTSRSGYLQRCLIKHLEGVKVAYDLTVRDSDNTVIQFNYGEDGMDISKVQFLNEQQLRFLSENAKGIVDDDLLDYLKRNSDATAIDSHQRSIEEFVSTNERDVFSKNHKAFTRFSSSVAHKVKLEKPRKLKKNTGRTKKDTFILELWSQVGATVQDTFNKLPEHCPSPVVSRFQPDIHFGAINERLQKLLARVDGDEAKDMLRLKAMQALCAPGDPVGLLAAQSIGEPSTQMTLNTFHFAGRGEMNVTLGIPRLREILMMASKEPKTPSMEIPFRNVPDLDLQEERLLKVLTRVVVADVLEKIDVSHELVLHPIRQYKYVLRFYFIPKRLYSHKYNVKPKKILKYMEKYFFKMMFSEIKRRARIKNDIASLAEKSKTRTTRTNEDGEDEEDTRGVSLIGDMSSDDEPEDVEDAKTTSKYKQINDAQEEDSDTEQIATTIIEAEDHEEENAGVTDTKATDTEAIRSHTVHTHQMAENYVFDTAHHEWCELTFNLPLGLKQVDLTALLRDVASRGVIWETPNIRRAIAYNDNGRRMLRTDGVNFQEMYKYAQLLDLDNLYSNDVHKVAGTYGIEAAARVVVREVRDVFKVYGITVDPRHLSLIADYMTFSGSFEPLNRKGMESSSSPLQQMSFESSLTFLKAAVLQGKRDNLQNPSSCLMLGKPCTIGTGAFSLTQNLKVYENVCKSEFDFPK